MDLGHEMSKQRTALLQSLRMYKNTLESTKRDMPKVCYEGTNERRYTDKDVETTLKQIMEARDGVIEQYLFLGGTEEELKECLRQLEEEDKKEKTIKVSLDDMVELTKNNTVDENPDDILEKAKKKKTSKPKTKKETTVKVKEPETEKQVTNEPDIITMQTPVPVVDKIEFIPTRYEYDPAKEFDLVPLPSKGECYASKNNTVAVEPLNASDENILVAPNLYVQMKVEDIILKRKIVSDIDPDDMIDGDRNAVILWLRATGYGNEYPVYATDEVTGKQFSATTDLSQIGFKPFKLKGDENGYFDFELPITKAKVKFKFLTHREKKNIELIDKYQNGRVLKGNIISMADELGKFIKNYNDLEDEAREKFESIQNQLTEAINDMEVDDVLLYNNYLTNSLYYSIVSINGETDREYIRKFIEKMPAKDSWSLRLYIQDNEPDVDFHFTVEKPASLGGGSQEVFLSVNQFVLFNVSR